MGVLKVILILLGSLLALVGLAGMCIFTAYTILPGPIYIRNNFIGLWLSIIICFLSLEFIYCVAKATRRIVSKLSLVFNMIYYVLVGLAGLFLALAYGLVWRVDSFGMGLMITAIAASSAAVLMIRRDRYVKKQQLSSGTSIKSGATTEMEQSSNMSNAKLLGKESSTEPASDSRRQIILRAFNVLLKLFWLVVLAFLCNGGFEIGMRKFWYPARGKFMNIALSDDAISRSLRIHYVCDGPTVVSANSSVSNLPTLVFEGDAGQSHADFLDLQKLLVKAGRRSCIWDKAGVGYSDFLFEDMAGNHSLYYDKFVRELAARGEKAPFVWLASGSGGGSLVYSYAAQNPDMVNSITFLDTLPLQFDWTAQSLIKNLTTDQLNSFIRFDSIKKHLKLFLINDFGVPFGLMRFLYRADETQTWWRSNPERIWYSFTEKTWITQRYFLSTLLAQPNVFAAELPPRIAVNHIMSVKDDAQVISQICGAKKWSVDSDECRFELKANKYSNEVKRSLIRGSGKVIECTLEACDREYFLYRDPQFTVNSLLALYP